MKSESNIPEDVDRQYSPDASSPVDRDGIERVINSVPEEEPLAEEEEGSAQGTNHHCGPEMVDVAAGAEGDGA